MAQELVLIPKDEYESLLSKSNIEPEHSEKTANESSEQQCSKNSLEDAKMPDEASQHNFLTKDDIVEKPKSVMSGSGKKYVRQSVEKFLAAQNSEPGQRQARAERYKKKKNVIKRRKWLRY